jgi:hypothetical protein
MTDTPTDQPVHLHHAIATDPRAHPPEEAHHLSQIHMSLRTELRDPEVALQHTVADQEAPELGENPKVGGQGRDHQYVGDTLQGGMIIEGILVAGRLDVMDMTLHMDVRHALLEIGHRCR